MRLCDYSQLSWLLSFPHFHTGAWYAVAANSTLLSSVCSLLPAQVALRGLGDSPFQWILMTAIPSSV